MYKIFFLGMTFICNSLIFASQKENKSNDVRVIAYCCMTKKGMRVDAVRPAGEPIRASQYCRPIQCSDEWRRLVKTTIGQTESFHDTQK